MNNFKFGHTYIKPIRLIPNWSLMEDTIPQDDIGAYTRIINDMSIRRISNSLRDNSQPNAEQINRDHFIPTRERNPDIPDLVIIDHLSLLTP
jgi:hypothetical protein